ncbi:MAG: diguanylate cyclase [Bacillota bacterium]
MKNFDQNQSEENKLIDSCPTAMNKLLVDLVDMLIVVFDKNLKVRKYNKAFEEIIFSQEKIENLNIYELLEDDVELNLPQKGEIKEQKLQFKDEIKIDYPFKCYLIREEDYYLLALKEERNEQDFFHKISQLNNELVNKSRELTRKNIELEKKKAKIEELLRKDNLTGLANRRSFEEFFEKIFSLARRHMLSLSLIMLDLDNFKKINDTYGHQIGDEVLKSIGELLKKNARQEDMAARVGGDEFYILQPNTSHKEAVNYVERLQIEIDKLNLPEVAHKISASFGVVELQDGEAMNEFMQRVDKEMYSAKMNDNKRI